MRHRSALSLGLATLALVAAPAFASTLVLDPFSDRLPPNPCLTASAGRVVFTGSYCDGTACPPASTVTCPDAFALQQGLPSVLGGVDRRLGLLNWNDENSSARIDELAGRVQVSFGGTTESAFGIWYGTPGDSYPSPGALNLDLDSGGYSGIRFHVAGDITPEKFLLVDVEFLSDALVYPRPSSQATIVVSQPGVVSLTFDTFERRLGFTFADVDDIQIGFDTCDYNTQPDCDAPALPRDFSIGPIEFFGEPTPAAKVSWGRLKTRYR